MEDVLSFIRCSILEILFFFFFFNDTATTEIYTLSLHDALPISAAPSCAWRCCRCRCRGGRGDRKSTRLNSSHMSISYAVFCLKKKKRRRLHPRLGPAARARLPGVRTRRLSAGYARAGGGGRLRQAHDLRRRRRFFFFNDTATTEIYTLSLHDALPI